MRTVQSPRSPFEVLFSRRSLSSAVERKAVDECQYLHVSEQPSAPREGCSSIEFSSVASPLRSVASVLRQVASAYGPSDSDPRKSPRNVLVGAFQQLRRTARTSVQSRIAKRFAVPSKRGVMRAWLAREESAGRRPVKH